MFYPAKHALFFIHYLSQKTNKQSQIFFSQAFQLLIQINPSESIVLQLYSMQTILYSLRRDNYAPRAKLVDRFCANFDSILKQYEAKFSLASK